MTNEQSTAGTIEAYLLQTVYMGDGAGKPTQVIANGSLMLYVGIGWIRLREADEEDYQIHPVVLYPEDKTKSRRKIKQQQKPEISAA